MPEIAPSSVEARPTRRAFLALAAAGAAGRPALAAPKDDELPVTGRANRHLEPFDKLMTAFVDGRLHEAADEVRARPDGDLFGEFLK